MAIQCDKTKYPWAYTMENMEDVKNLPTVDDSGKPVPIGTIAVNPVTHRVWRFLIGGWEEFPYLDGQPQFNI